MARFKAPRGTNDILPDEQPYWEFVRRTADQTAALFGYQRIDTPVFEDADLFVHSTGEATDIVQKEMYVFEDRGGNRLALRPEGTPNVCRAYLEHGMQNRPQPVRLYYIDAMFRYDRPQAGRYRQFHQFGVEAIGEADPVIDAEVIELQAAFYHALGLHDFTVLLNSIGDRACRPQYVEVLRRYYAEHLGEVCEDCRERFKRNPLRLLDCKNARCQPVIAAAPVITDYLCVDCRAHFTALRETLEALGLQYQLEPRLVRGLDYYTRTTWEFVPPTEGAQSTIGGGGRYDYLIGELGGPPTPGIGFATGIERIILNLKRLGVEPPPLPQPEVFIAVILPEARATAARLAQSLRQAGVGIWMGMAGRSLKAQMRQADARRARYTLILGAKELEEGTITLRDMTSATQETLRQEEVVERLRERNE